MLTFIGTLYISVQLISLVFSWPQLRQLFVMKDSDELSLTTWATWTMAQSVTLLYAAVSQQILWLVMSVAWLVFDIAMVALIIKYRPKKQLQPEVLIEK